MSGFFCLHDYLYKYLVQSDRLEKADLIFVLAGHPSRKIYAAHLYRDAWAPRVLFSTSNPPFIARTLLEECTSKMASTIKLGEAVGGTAALESWPRGQFFAIVDNEEWSIQSVPIGLLGTLSEMRALADWLRNRPSVRFILLVSVGTHLRRLKMCCRRLMARDYKLRFIEVPQDLEVYLGPGMVERRTFARVLKEWIKVLFYGIVLIFSRNRPSRH